MAEQIPPLTPRQSRAVARYEETKQLAEMAWAALLMSDKESTWERITEQAWNAAETMHAESERRRPQE